MQKYISQFVILNSFQDPNAICFKIPACAGMTITFYLTSNDRFAVK
ncbi:hypothetical protein QF042_001247 [Pedobacter sp. W3I1]|nr:hypothetical protein [Pedobacter sp. W3I1]